MKTAWSADSFAAVSLFGVTALAFAAAWLRPLSRFSRVEREGGTVFLGESLMHRGYALAQPLVRVFVAARISPDAISWFSLLVGLASGVAVASGSFGFGAWLLALSGLGDMLDGAVARERGCASARGAVLDSVLDRYVEFFFLGGLLIWFSGEPGLQLVCMAALLGSFMVTYSTAKAEALGVEPPRGWMKRPERVVWLIYGTAAAGIVGACGGPRLSAMAFVVALIALFSHLSAWRRLGALQSQVDKKD